VQQGVLEALGDVVAEVVSEQGTATQVGERLAGAADRFLKENVKELGRVIGAELLEVVRSRLGPQFGKALAQYVARLKEEMDDTVAARLAAAAGESMADVLASFAAEVVSLADTRRIGLFFDAGERLNEEESRLLVDLAERLPEHVHMRVAFATFGGQTVARVAELRLLAPASHEIAVSPLDPDEVEEWLADAGIHADLAQMMKATAGYPLHVGDVVRDIELGGKIEDAPLNEQSARRAEASWNALSAPATSVARKLCVLEDPLPEPRLRQLVGLDAAALGEVVDELVRGRIFLTEVEGRPWFHEQRRAFVRRKLFDAELDEAATRASEAVWAELEETDESRYVAAFAELAVDAKTLQHQDAKLAAALKVTESEHAVLAALLELMTPQNRGAAEADQLFRHARRFSDLELQPADILPSLEDCGLVVTVSDERATVVVPTLSGQAIAAVVGGAYRRLTRPPIPELSALVFQVGLLPCLGDFTQARFGIGRPSVGGLARTAGGGDAEVGFGATAPNRREPGLHLLGRGRYADRPIWLVSSYSSPDAREAAHRAVESLRTELFGDELGIDEVFRHPLEVVPEQRFVKAGTRAVGLTSFDVRETGDIRVALDVSLPSDRGYELRVETAKLLRERSTPLERYAMELDQTFGLYWDERDKTRIECTVYGGEELAVRVPGLADGHDGDRYLFFDIEQRLRLDPKASLQNVTGGWGLLDPIDPVFAELARRRQRAFAFNSAQPRRRVVLDEVTLRDLVTTGFQRLMADARAFASIMVREPVALPTAALYVYVLLEPPTQGWRPGYGSSVIALEVETDASRDEVQFALSEGGVDLSGFLPRVIGDIQSHFEEAFGFAPERAAPGFLIGSRAHDVDSLLSEYAGFSEDSVEMRWPGEP
jgi:hypothetical protein